MNDMQAILSYRLDVWRTGWSMAFLLGLALLSALPAHAGYLYDASDFATEVVYYDEGTGVGNDWLSGEGFNNPDAALGRPTVDTTGDNWYIPSNESVPVNPVYPAFRATELVTIGNGGSLVVAFDHAVENDAGNPYGVDFIVFGNSFQVIGGGQGWTNGDPNETTVSGNIFAEPGILSVSQGYLGLDGQVDDDPGTWAWHTFDLLMDLDGDGDSDTDPAADGFAPTLGRVYDPANPDTSLGAWNEWWGDATDPTLPIDPLLDAEDLAGYTVAEIALLYGESAGGAGFDLDWLDVDLDWFQYIRIDGLAAGGTTEIDAFADVATLAAETAVPEPSTVCLLAVAAAGMLALCRKR
jgi:hypothetical protein